MLNRFSTLMLIVLLPVGLLAATPTAEAQTTWYVDDDAPNDPGPGDSGVSDPLEDGSPEHPFDKIREGINASTDGDTILVADGMYNGLGNRNLNLQGKAIVVRSENGSSSCVIDSGQHGRGFFCGSGETTDTVIDGFTITNGDIAYGSGVCCWAEGSPTITNCIIVKNHASCNGGGICCYEGSNPTITNCVISDNDSGNGGGVCCMSGGNPTITKCVITDNDSENGGGVCCLEESSPTITNCVIANNYSACHGGGFCTPNYFCDPIITNCTIRDNYAENNGGGIYGDGTIRNCFICGNSSHRGGGVGRAGTLIDCVIENNHAYDLGGGVYRLYGRIDSCIIRGNTTDGCGGGIAFCKFSSAGTSYMISGCLIADNCASDLGGGAYAYDDTRPTFANCVLVNNTATTSGGAVYCSSRNTLDIQNCCLWGNYATVGPELTLTDFTDATVAYSDIQDGVSSVCCDNSSTLEWGNGNIDADPIFVDPDGPDNDPNTWEDNDYHLSAGSPCIDAADNTAVPLDTLDLDNDGDIDERTPFDLDGNPRFVQDPLTPDTGVADPPYYRYVVDMGAYEFQFCFGDLDDDNNVDIADLAQLLGSYGETSGMTYYDGDLDGDGDVDLVDLAELLGVYGTVCE